MSRFLQRLSLALLATSLFCADHALASDADYACDGAARLHARFSSPSLKNGRVTLTFGDGQMTTLPQAPSADGGRYAGHGVEFWTKGRGATLTRNGARQTCHIR